MTGRASGPAEVGTHEGSPDSAWITFVLLLDARKIRLGINVGGDAFKL